MMEKQDLGVILMFGIWPTDLPPNTSDACQLYYALINIFRYHTPKP